MELGLRQEAEEAVLWINRQRAMSVGRAVLRPFGEEETNTGSCSFLTCLSISTFTLVIFQTIDGITDLPDFIVTKTILDFT